MVKSLTRTNMNILFDFLTFRVKTGAGEYGRRILYELLSTINSKKEYNLYALYDSTYTIAYDDLNENSLKQKYNISFIDCKNTNIANIIKKENIDRFFISCGHYFMGRNDIINIQCDTICVIHDLYGEENVSNKIYHYIDLIDQNANEKKTFRYHRILKHIPLINKYINKIDNFGYDYLISGGKDKYSFFTNHIIPAIKLAQKNPLCKLITVSEYSKYSICYNFHFSSNDIQVLYSPERLYATSNTIHNEILRKLIQDKQHFYLMVSANRKTKNPNKVINAFKEYSKTHPNVYLVTVGDNTKYFENHICLPFLEECDLTEAYKKCYALIFSSFFEGFGYPPLEAMHYGKPVLCSNTTSMPEIFENAPIYFSPFYESGIFKALCELTEFNYNEYSNKSFYQYNKIKKRQTADLQKIISMIISPIQK